MPPQSRKNGISKKAFKKEKAGSCLQDLLPKTGEKEKHQKFPKAWYKNKPYQEHSGERLVNWGVPNKAGWLFPAPV